MAILKAEVREGKGKYKAFELRKAGKIPGVVYGKGLKENVNVALVLKDFLAVLKKGDRIIDLDVDGSSRRVLIKAVQHGTYDHEILHADFRAISAEESIEVEVEIVLKGDAVGVATGGLLEHNLHSVAIRCLPGNLPERIAVDVSNLDMGQIIYARDLPKQDGVEYIFHGNPAVVSCHHPRGAETAAPAAEETPTAPEVIGEKEREAKSKDKE